MRGAAFLILSTGLTAGCHTTKHDVSVPIVEEYRTAPNDPNYNSPPEQGYKPKERPKEFKPGVGGSGGPGGGMGGGPGGMGGGR